MLDMERFTLTKHDEEILWVIKSVKQNSKEHKTLAEWAIECLGRVMPAFEKKYPAENILETAVATLQKWIHDEIKMWDARNYTYTVLALAKEMQQTDKPYAQIVRATSHCLATCHVPTHAEGTAMYVVSAIKLLNKGEKNMLDLMYDERTWQINRLKEMMKSPRATD